jgi:CO/xanthine dehydrogenase Mo-binding subunit
MSLTKPFDVVGKAEIHDVSMYKSLTGHLDFTDDRMPGEKWYGAVKVSTIAHGSVKTLDATEALKEPGVKGVWWNDVGPIVAPATAGVKGPNYMDGFSGAANILSYGQAIAVVVADDWDTARRATALIKVTYDVLPVVYDPDEAVKSSSPLSGRQATSNETTSTFFRPGLAADGKTALSAPADFTGADVTINTTEPWGPTFQHNPMHPRQGLAWMIGDDLYGWTSTQNGLGIRSGLASATGLQLHKVHARTHACGGGHGDGGSETYLQMAARCSMKLGGHAVLVRLTRDNHNSLGSRHYNTKASFKVGAKKDGTLVAWKGDWSGVGGGASGCWYGLRTTFKIPSVEWVAHNVYCNVPGRGAWRCISDTPGAMEYDATLDKLAAQLDMNPWDLRMKNIMAFDAPDQDSPYRVWSGKGVNECFNQVYKQSGYATKWHKPATGNVMPDGRLHGISITGHHDSHAGINGTSRYGHIRMGGQDNTGKCIVYGAGAKASEGPQTQMSIFVAEVLGLKWEDIYFDEWGNSDVNFDTGNQVGSGHTGAGTSYINTAMEMRKRLFERAITLAPLKDIAGITVADLDAKNSEIFYTKDPTKKTTHAAVVTGWEPQVIVLKGWASALISRGVGTAKIGDACNTNGGAAACAEVAVDIETGQVEVLNFWNAVDTGTTIFRQGVMKELGSGCEIMMNYTFFYGDIYDPSTAAIMAMGHMNFNHQTAMDFNPNSFHLIDVESDDAAGPFGAHGIGEPAVTNASALYCAVFNATGKWFDWKSGSGTPDKLLIALGKA